MTLYQFPLREQLTELQTFLLKSGPATAGLLGWFLGSKVFELDPLDKLKIWTSHAQPLQTNELVVWIFESQEGVQVFVTSELVLSKGEFTREALDIPDLETYEKELSAYFVDPQLENLYKESKEFLAPILKEYKSQKEGKVFFEMINILWSPVIYKIWDAAPLHDCFQFMKPISNLDTEKEIELSEGLKLTNLEESDIETISSLKSISYEEDYIRDCIRVSSAIRTADNELVAYAMTHRNFLIASLHVVAEHRRKGYAEIIIDDICKKYKNFFQNALPDHPYEMYVIATVIKSNTASANLFRKSGWTTFGLGCGWFYGK